MENKKYVVCRDDIYVGEVVRTDSISYCYNKNNYDYMTLGITGPYKSYRSMLFVPNEVNLANDLLYRSPNYPVLKVTEDQLCLKFGENTIIIKNACNLAALLEYFGYKKDLTFKDIMKIRKTFFTGRFAKDNCELFGYKETMAEDVTFYDLDGEVVTDPLELKIRRNIFKSRQRAGHRMFSSVGEGPLPKEYFDVLNQRGNNSLRDIAEGFSEKTNAFTPHKEEGPVKRLKRC